MLSRLCVAAAIGALTVTTLLAQPRGGGGFGGPGGGFGPPRVDNAQTIANELKLSATQQEAVFAILDDAQKQATPLVAEVDASRQALMTAYMQKTPQEPAMQKITEIEARMVALEADAFSKILQKLEDKQKSKAPKLFELMNGIFARGNWRVK